MSYYSSPQLPSSPSYGYGRNTSASKKRLEELALERKMSLSTLGFKEAAALQGQVEMLTNRLTQQTALHGAISRLQMERIGELELELEAGRRARPQQLLQSPPPPPHAAAPAAAPHAVPAYVVSQLPPLLERAAAAAGPLLPQQQLLAEQLTYTQEQVERLADAHGVAVSEMRAAQREAEMKERIIDDLKQTLARFATSPRRSRLLTVETDAAQWEEEAKAARAALEVSEGDILALASSLADARIGAEVSSARIAAAEEDAHALRSEMERLVHDRSKLPLSSPSREVARLKLEVISLRSKLERVDHAAAQRHDASQRSFWGGGGSSEVAAGAGAGAGAAEGEEGRRGGISEQMSITGGDRGAITALTMGDDSSQVLLMPDGSIFTAAKSDEKKKKEEEEEEEEEAVVTAVRSHADELSDQLRSARTMAGDAEDLLARCRTGGVAPEQVTSFMEDYARTHEEVDNFAQQLMALSNETGALRVVFLCVL